MRGLWLKRGVLALLSVLLALVVFGGAMNLLIGPALNQSKAGKLEHQLMAMEMPEGVERVEVHTVSGNTSGTGNHVEIWGGILCRTQDDLVTLRAKFPEMSCISLSDIQKNGYYPVGYELFSKLAEVADGGEYYMLETYEDAVTQWDIRGH